MGASQMSLVVTSTARTSSVCSSMPRWTLRQTRRLVPVDRCTGTRPSVTPRAFFQHYAAKFRPLSSVSRSGESGYNAFVDGLHERLPRSDRRGSLGVVDRRVGVEGREGKGEGHIVDGIAPAAVGARALHGHAAHVAPLGDARGIEGRGLSRPPAQAQVAVQDLAARAAGRSSTPPPALPRRPRASWRGRAPRSGRDRETDGSRRHSRHGGCGHSRAAGGSSAPAPGHPGGARRRRRRFTADRAAGAGHRRRAPRPARGRRTAATSFR